RHDLVAGALAAALDAHRIVAQIRHCELLGRAVQVERGALEPVFHEVLLGADDHPARAPCGECDRQHDGVFHGPSWGGVGFYRSLSRSSMSATSGAAVAGIRRRRYPWRMSAGLDLKREQAALLRALRALGDEERGAHDVGYLKSQLRHL